MSSERVEEVFIAALECAPGDREPYLDAACGGDAGLRAEVDALLAERDTMGDFLATPCTAGLQGVQFDEGDRVGRYLVLDLLGTGAAGTVYLAQQSQPRRQVALKVLHAALAGEAETVRFQDEAEILARLQHPGIAHVYEAGVHEGAPYFALEYVEGGATLRDYAEERGLDRDARLALFILVCDAVQHGHQKGIIHRDLKPGNVLVTPDGQPKVIDFGIARTEQRTDPQHAMGTPPYMSPEQCDVEQPSADVRSDVHALGVMLYELLAGRRPYRTEGLSFFEAGRVLREQPAAALNEVPADLAAVVSRAMAKDPEQRYPSASALAAELRRFLEHRPVEAQRGTLLYQLRKFARRQRVAFAAMTALILVSITAAVLSANFALQSDRARRGAEYESYVANVRAAASALRDYDVLRARQHLDAAPPDHRGWEWQHLIGRVEAGEWVHRDPGGNFFAAARIPGGNQVALVRRSGTSSDRNRIAILDSGERSWVLDLPHHLGTGESIAVSPDGARIAIGFAGSGKLELLEFDAGTRVWLRDAHKGNLTMIAFHPQGDRLATSGYDGCVRVWSVANGELLNEFTAHEGVAMCLAYSGDGNRIFSGGGDGTIRSFDAGSGRELLRIDAHESNVEDIALGPGDELIASGGVDGRVCVWNVRTAERVAEWEGHTNFVKAVDFHPAGRFVVSASIDRTVRVYDVFEKRQVACHVGHVDWVADAIFLADGQHTLSVDRSGALRIWSLDSRGDVPSIHVPEQQVRQLAFSADGRELSSLSGSMKGWHLRQWRVASGELLGTPELKDEHGLLFGYSGGRRVFVQKSGGGESGILRGDGSEHVMAHGSSVQVRELESGRVTRSIEGASRVTRLACSGDEQIVAAARADQSVQLLDVRTWTVLATFQAPAVVTALALDRTGNRVALATASAELILIDRRTGRRIRSKGRAHVLAFSPDGTRLAGGGIEVVRLWDTATGSQVAELRGHPLRVASLAWSPDGRVLASGGYAHESLGSAIRLWELPR